MAAQTHLVDEQQKFTKAVKEGALVVVSHSGGKDSMAMLERLVPIVPKGQMIVIHAHLVDDDPAKQIVWPGTRERAAAHAHAHGLEFFEVIAQFKDPALIKGYGRYKTMFNLARRRIDLHPEWCPWPSPREDRWCTSDLKRGPINFAVGEYQRSHGFTTIIDAEGIRAEESGPRKERAVWEIEERRTSSRRTWIKYSPIHTMKVNEVFDTIACGGHRPHWIYEKKACGNDRCSCSFCIFGSANDLRNAAVFMPELYAKFVKKETETAPYHFMPKGRLVDVVGMTPQEAMARRRPIPRLDAGALAGETGRAWNISEGGQVQPPCDRADPTCWESTKDFVARLGSGAEGTMTLALGPEYEDLPDRQAQAAFMVRGDTLLVSPQPADLAAQPPRWLSWAELQDRVYASQGRWVAIAPGATSGAPQLPREPSKGTAAPVQPQRFVVAPSMGRCWNVYDTVAGIIYPQDYVSQDAAQVEVDRLNGGR